MKFSMIANALLLLSAFTLAQSARANELTDEMAIEEGMTPIEEVMIQDSMNTLDDGSLVNFNRAEYVTTIPSMDDIQRVIGSHRQVIVVNKAKSGPDAQTLRVYLNGRIKPLVENKIISKTVNGKRVVEVIPESKEFVKISTGREGNETAKSGRKYVSTTPKGFFRPQRVYTMYYSNTWKADMPNAIFMCPTFQKECGIAIHATTESHYAELGTRASGGCVRTRQEISKQLREIVMDSGRGSAPGQFSTVTESHRRWKVTNNSVSVDNLERFSGSLTGKINSWDTVIVVYE